MAKERKISAGSAAVLALSVSTGLAGSLAGNMLVVANPKLIEAALQGMTEVELSAMRQNICLQGDLISTAIAIAGVILCGIGIGYAIYKENGFSYGAKEKAMIYNMPIESRAMIISGAAIMAAGMGSMIGAGISQMGAQQIQNISIAAGVLGAAAIVCFFADWRINRDVEPEDDYGYRALS